MLIYLYRMFCIMGILAWVTMVVTSCSTSRGGRPPVHAPIAAEDESGAQRTQSPTWPRTASRNKRRIAQQDFGREAAFVACRYEDCPAVTPKTWAPSKTEPDPTVDARSSGEDVPEVLISDTASSKDPARWNMSGQIITRSSPLDMAPRFAEKPAHDGPPLLPSPQNVQSANPRSHQALTEASPSKLLLVHFALGDDTLSDKAKRLIEQGVDSVSTVSPIHLVAISGRTDNVGSPSLNESLAWSRARAVKSHLLSKYPELASLVNVQAQGKCCFRASNQTEQGRAMNRRVELFIEARPIESSVAP